jgi:selenocysteine-specific translation elongation factor
MPDVFRMVVDDVFNIRGRGPVVIGCVETGRIELGQRLSYTGARVTRTVEVSRIEKFRQPQLTEASAGPEDVGLELDGITVRDMPSMMCSLASTQSRKPGRRLPVRRLTPNGLEAWVQASSMATRVTWRGTRRAPTRASPRARRSRSRSRAGPIPRTGGGG